jgi:hypothetical protein
MVFIKLGRGIHARTFPHATAMTPAGCLIRTREGLDYYRNCLYIVSQEISPLRCLLLGDMAKIIIFGLHYNV